MYLWSTMVKSWKDPSWTSTKTSWYYPFWTRCLMCVSFTHTLLTKVNIKPGTRGMNISTRF